MSNRAVVRYTVTHIVTVELEDSRLAPNVINSLDRWAEHEPNLIYPTRKKDHKEYTVQESVHLAPENMGSRVNP